MELNVSSVQSAPKTSTGRTASTPFGRNALLRTALNDSFTPSSAVSFGATPLQIARSQAKKAKVDAFNIVRAMIDESRIQEIVRGIRAASSIDYLLEPRLLRDKSQLSATMRIVSGLKMPQIRSEKQAANALRTAIEEKLSGLKTKMSIESSAAELKKAGLISDEKTFAAKLQDYLVALARFKEARKGRI